MECEINIFQHPLLRVQTKWPMNVGTRKVDLQLSTVLLLHVILCCYNKTQCAQDMTEESKVAQLG